MQLQDKVLEKTYPNQEMCIHELVERQVNLHPDRIAVSFEETSLTFEQLNIQANRLAAFLKKKGVETGTPVFVCLDRSLEMVVALLGILKAGGAYVPLDPETPNDRMAYMVQNVQTSFLITTIDKEGIFKPFMDQLKDMVFMDENEKWAHYSSNNNRNVCENENLMYIIYTSGSTGNPKGVMNTHKALNNRLQWVQGKFSLDSNDKVLQKTPYTFDVSVWEFFWPLISGATLVMARPGGHRDPVYLKEIIQKENITTIHFVPSMLGTFLESIKEGECSTLRRVLCSGEALTKKYELEFFKKFKSTKLFNLYGPTEAAIDVTCWDCTGNPDEKVVPIGYPISNIHLHILDKKGEPVPIGEVGELHIGGVGVAKGYYGNVELTKKSFVDNTPYGRLYKTGDLCRYREDHSIEYIGREDFQVKVRGFRIELGEIEIAIERHEHIKQCIVKAIERGEDVHLVAYLTLNEQSLFNESNLKESLLKSLPSYMIPSFFIPIDSFPLNTNGKIDRNKLPDPFDNLKWTGEKAKTELERKVFNIWEDLLQVKNINTGTSFLQVGGNSLFAARLVTRFREDLGVNITLKEVFAHPTIKQQAILVGETHREIEVAECKKMEVRRKVPLSDAQKRLWFINKLEGESPLYNLPQYMVLKGRLDVLALEESVKHVITQHDIFKYRFIEDEGVPYLVIDNQFPTEIEIVDFSNLNLEEAKEKAFNTMNFDARKVFDFESGPLYRIILYCLSSEDYILYFNFHHIISDGWSNQVFRDSVFSHYLAKTEGYPLLNQPIVQYQDYIYLQENLEKTSEYEKHLQYWESQLPKNTPALHLHAGSKVSSCHEGKEKVFNFSPEQINRLEKYCEEKECTMYMAMLAIYKIFIHRLSLENDVSVGSPVSGRKRKEFEQLIGFFVNTVVIRNEVNPMDTFGEFLCQVKESTLNAFSHDDVPFEKVVKRIKPNRSLNETPLFQYMFSFLDIPETEFEIDGLEVGKIRSLHNETSKFNLTLTIVKQTERFVGKWEYRTDSYTEEIMNYFTNLFLNLLNYVVENPNTPINKLLLLSEMDNQELIEGLNQTKVEFPYICLHELFEEQVKKTPENIAAVYEGGSLTYRELETKSNQLAHLLLSQGIQPDTPIGVRMDRSLELVVSIMGILKAGGAYLPIDMDVPKSRMYTLLEDAKAPFCLVNETIDEIGQENTEFILIDLASEELSFFDKNKPKCEVSPENLVSIYYTSGSTGKPKGVCSTHQGWVNRMCWMQNKHRLMEKDVVLQKTTLTFDDAAVEFFWPLMVGGIIALIPPGTHRDPKIILDYAIKYNVAVLQFVPSMLQMILDEITLEQKEKLTNLRVVVSSGEALKKDVVNTFYEKFPGRLFNSWGATEVSIDSTCYDCLPFDPNCKDVIYVGRPIDNNRVYVLDEELAPVPYGVPGNLYIAGIGLAKGYLNNPVKTEESFIQDPFYNNEKMYKTGDRGYIDIDKNIMFLGREDNQVKIRGMRVELGEIESTVRNLSGIKDAVVLTHNKQQLVLYYVTESAELKPNQIKNRLTSILPAYMVPVYYVELDTMPLNSNGKVDRKKLKKPTEENLILRSTYSESKNRVEEKLLKIWREKLCLDHIGTNDDFFELGGHSLLAVQVVSQLNKEFKTNVSVKSLFENPTISEISKMIEFDENNPPFKKINTAKNRDDLFPLSDAQKRIWFLDKMRENTDYNMPLVLKFGGHVDIERLNKAMSRVISRHEILRTNFIMFDGEVWQKVHREINVPLEIKECDKVDLQEIIHTQMSTRFNLQEEPLLRGLVIRDKEHDTLILIMHHIIGDGWSLKILQEELLGLYNRKNEVVQETPVQYADYAIWQQTEEETINKQLSFWKEQLKGEIPYLELSSDNHQHITCTKNITINRSITPSLAMAIRDFCKTQKVTPFMFVLSTFKVLLSRLSNQTDIIVGTPIVNRNQKELERAIGLYLNTLPIRSQIKSNETFLQLLSQIKSTVINTFANQDVPFERIVEEVNPERNVSRNPLFDVMINYRSFNEEVYHADDLEVEEIEVEEIASKFYITLYIEEVKDGFNIQLSYQNKRYSQLRMEEFLNQYFHLLNAFLDCPDCLISDTSLITDSSGKMLPNPKEKLKREVFPSVVGEINKWTKLYPEKIAIETGNMNYSYLDLLTYSSSIAKSLRNQGVKPGDVIAIYGSRSFEMIGSILAVLKAGGTFLNIDAQIPYNRVKYMLEQSNAKVLLFSSKSKTDAYHELILDIDLKVMESEHLYKRGKVLDDKEIDLQADILHENAYIFFTSGTTGVPKGILGTHNGLAHFLSWQREEFSVTPADRSAQLIHLTFDAYLRDIFLPLTSGATLCIPEGNINEMDLLDWLGKNKITLLHSVPSLTKLWLAKAEGRFENHLRHIFLAGESLTSHLVNKWRTITHAQINNFYGQTETTMIKSFYSIKERVVDNVLPIGKPIQGTQFLLINSFGKMCGVGEQGEIMVRTPYLTKGYLQNNQNTFEKNPFSNDLDDLLYRTGDIGRYKPDGNIEILGREDEQIKIRGVRVDKNEVTATILRQPNVKECAVVDWKNNGDTQLIAFVVSSKEDWDPDLLRMSLSNDLTLAMIPSRFVLINELPVTSNGKIDKKKLLEFGYKQTKHQKYDIEIMNEWESELRDIWGELLQKSELGLDDNFFEMGGYSLMIVRMVAMIKAKWGKEVTLLDVFRYPTIRSLAYNISVDIGNNKVSTIKKIDRSKYVYKK